jgi:hypothetical protein
MMTKSLQRGGLSKWHKTNGKKKSRTQAGPGRNMTCCLVEMWLRGLSIFWHLGVDNLAERVCI